MKPLIAMRSVGLAIATQGALLDHINDRRQPLISLMGLGMGIKEIVATIGATKPDIIFLDGGDWVYHEIEGLIPSLMIACRDRMPRILMRGGGGNIPEIYQLKGYIKIYHDTADIEEMIGAK